MRNFTFLVLTVIICGAPFFAQAASGDDYPVREQCFATLKDNLAEAEAVIPATALAELGKMSYGDVESKFSQNYKNLSSFGIELSEPNLEMRVYSFGRQTGYIHPPKLPFPAYYESDSWAVPAKEYIVAEEYVVDENSEKHFIGCAFFAIHAENLLEVTSENYAYDGAAVSLTKVDPAGSYKAWYSQSTSYNYQDQPFADWTRLFIYPKATQNSYFDKYSVAEVFPAHSIQSFDVLNFFEQHLIALQDLNETGEVQTKYVILDDDLQIVEVVMPLVLKPVEPQGLDQNFAFASYYQAIEDYFPEFAKNLSLRGTLNFETYKELLVLPELDPEIENLLHVIIDPRQLAKYSLDKVSKEAQGMKVSNPVMDKLLADIKDVDILVKPFVSASGTVAAQDNDDASTSMTLILMVVSAVILLAAIFTAVVLRKKFNFTNSSL